MTNKSVILETTQELTIKRNVKLVGTKPIMFDRYAGDNNTKLEPWQKLYFEKAGSRVIGLPATNLISFLSAHNTNSAPKRLRDKRKYKDICNAMLSFVDINPDFIQLTKDGTPIEFGVFETTETGAVVDHKSGIYVHKAVARLKDGIPNPKERPTLPLPWGLEFTLTIYPNKEIKEQEIVNLIQEGGRAIGLGTWRGAFGKFTIATWE